MKFLVVSPPFVIAVDSFGQPDPGHAMLDIPASLSRTRLEGTDVQVLDAAVVADKLVLVAPAWLLMCDSSLCARRTAASNRITCEQDWTENIILNSSRCTATPGFSVEFAMPQYDATYAWTEFRDGAVVPFEDCGCS